MYLRLYYFEQTYTASLEATETGGKITFEVASDKFELLCTDWFVFATREDLNFKAFTRSGTHHRMANLSLAVTYNNRA